MILNIKMLLYVGMKYSKVIRRNLKFIYTTTKKQPSIDYK